jgi:hypothetical protein
MGADHISRSTLARKEAFLELESQSHHSGAPERWNWSAATVKGSQLIASYE